MKASLDALEHGGERPAFAPVDRAVEKLRLAPIPMGRNHVPPRNLIGDRRAKIAADEMKAQVEPRGTAGRRENLALIDIEHVWINTHLGETALQRLRISPVRGRALAIQEAGGSKYK